LNRRPSHSGWTRKRGQAMGSFIEEARGRAEETGLEVEFIQADMRESHRPGAFRVVPKLFTSFGLPMNFHFLSPAQYW